MCLMFMRRRKTPFTHEHMTAQELLDLQAYAKREKLSKKAFRRMYLAFGRIKYQSNLVEDLYDFAPAPNTSVLNVLINILCLYHRFGYEGYKIKIELGATPTT